MGLFDKLFGTTDNGNNTDTKPGDKKMGVDLNNYELEEGELDDDTKEGGQFFEERIRGKLTRVDPKGFGFITSREIPYTRIFFHWSGLLQSTRNFKDLQKGMTVEFNPFLLKDKGYRALRISVVEDTETEN